MESIRTANVLVTDTVGSTNMLVRGGEEAADAHRHRHEALVEAVVGVFAGRIVKSTGDGLLAVLPSADYAVRAGAGIQEAATSAGLSLRVAVTTGDVVGRDSDCFGEPVVVAFRLCDHCPAGAVLVDSATVVVRGRRRDPPVERFGSMLLRGFDEPIDVWQVLPVGDDPLVRQVGEPVAIVGRTDELGHISAAGRTEASTLVVLTGEPGIGKTHLARAAAGPQSLWVRFASTEADGFTAWRTALDEWAATVPAGRIAALGSEAVARLAALLPSVAERFPVRSPAPADEAERNQSFVALGALVQIAGDGRAVVLDDVQWAGGTSHELLATLLTSTSGLRFIATSRSPVPAPVAARATATLRLGGLDRDELATLLRSRGVDAAGTAAAVDRSGGNPLLALVAAEQPSASGTSNPVAAVFLDLPSAERETLGTAALIGRTIDVALLAELLAEPVPVVARRLDLAVQTGLLTGSEQLSFVHDLVREAAEATIPAHRRVALHASVADALLERHDTVGALPHLIEGFGALDPKRAIEEVVHGGDLLVDRLAFEEVLHVAVRLNEVVHADHRCGPDQESATLLKVSWAHQLLGDVSRHKVFALRAGRRAMAGSDVTVLAEAATARASYGLAGLADPDTAELLHVALARVPPDALALRARLLASQAFYLINYEGLGEEARRTALEALAIARRSGDIAALADALSGRLFVLLAGSDVIAQSRLIDELRPLVPRLRGRGDLESMMQRQLGPLRLQVGDRPGFEESLGALQELAAHRGSWLLRSLTTTWRGLAALLDGRPDEAERMATELLAPHRDHNFGASAAGLLTAAYRWRGMDERVAADVARYATDQPGIVLATSLAVVSLILAGDDDAGAAMVDGLLARERIWIDDTTLSAQLAAIIEACVLAGRPLPEQVVDQLHAFSGQLLVLSWGVEVIGAADRFLAIAAAMTGDQATARTSFDRAAELERRVSDILPLRTQVWRHVLLGDVPEPEIPSELGGLRVEGQRLRAAQG